MRVRFNRFPGQTPPVDPDFYVMIGAILGFIGGLATTTAYFVFVGGCRL